MKNVKFCIKCDQTDNCRSCEKLFSSKAPFKSTSFIQVKEDFTSFLVVKKNMIADIGCPNTVIGEKDAENFQSCLTKFQRENLEYITVDDNFKFGLSGPYKCKTKLRFPIKNDPDLLWVNVALVKADIPMLLGNNILKPLGAQIELFASGNGVLKLQNTEMELHETPGGHYTIRLSDLGKLCATAETSILCTEQASALRCGNCGETFINTDSLKEHMQIYHRKTAKSALKNPLKGKTTAEVSENGIMTDLNTQLNRSNSKREKKLISTMKDILQLQQSKSRIQCEQCNQLFKSLAELDMHMLLVHEDWLACDMCGKMFETCRE